MSAGKLSSQAGHAYTDTLMEAPSSLQAAYKDKATGGYKVTIQCKNLDQLLAAQARCKEAGIVHSLVTDSEHVMLPHFTGEEIVTALGIGPCTKSQVRDIAKKFNSVP